MKLLIPLLAFAALICIFIFGTKFFFALFTGAINAVLGVVVVIALIIIVIWMFSYANKMNRKK